MGVQAENAGQIALNLSAAPGSFTGILTDAPRTIERAAADRIARVRRDYVLGQINQPSAVAQLQTTGLTWDRATDLTLDWDEIVATARRFDADRISSAAEHLSPVEQARVASLRAGKARPTLEALERALGDAPAAGSAA